MNICYIVYREDNVMVFDSQVLNYLKNLMSHPDISSIKLILFRHQSNLNKREMVENKIHKYIDDFKTFSTISPPLSLLQLEYDSIRLKNYILNEYKLDDEICVICRGDFATYISIKAFRSFPNSRLLFDNRGLPYEESLFSHPKGFIHHLNRRVKKKSILFSKDHCDGYNFVTNNMRDYLLHDYNYNSCLPFTIIPTMYSPEVLDPNRLKEIIEEEKYQENQFVLSYIGSTTASQEIDKVLEVIKLSYERIKSIRFFILTNGDIPELDKLPNEIRNKITKKCVPHDDIKYYLYISNVGLVIRDSILINQVAAPTKITEYIIAGLRILFIGDIGIIRDIKDIVSSDIFIRIDEEGEWLDKLDSLIMNPRNNTNPKLLAYFDLNTRQNETIQLFKKCLINMKVR